MSLVFFQFFITLYEPVERQVLKTKYPLRKIQCLRGTNKQANHYEIIGLDSLKKSLYEEWRNVNYPSK